MKCVGCDETVESPAAFAIMNEVDVKEISEAVVAKTGPGRFHALAVCFECFVNPEHRKRVLKAHFAPVHLVGRMLGLAGSTNIGG